jgi:hypothetical protein
MNAAAVLGAHGGETYMGIYCTFQLSPVVTDHLILLVVMLI